MKVRNLIFAVTAIGLEAQTLSIVPSTISQARIGSLIIRLNSPGNRGPVALQWELILPLGVVADQAEMAAGSAAASADKDLSCMEKKTGVNEKRSVFACILSGGQKRIPNGVIALVQYRVATTVAPAAYPVQIDSAIGISADMQKFALEKAEGTITVH